jgi:hypothetical protein
MAVVTGGRERTLSDWERLLASQGLTLHRTTPVPGDGHYRVIEAGRV